MAQKFQMVIMGDGGRVDHTPGSAVAAGDVVITNGLFQFATQPIVASALGTLRKQSNSLLVRGVKINGAVSVGNLLYWDANGDPEGGTSGTGALTTTATGNTVTGVCVKAAAAGDETVDFDMDISKLTVGGLENAIADPGTGNPIPVTQTGHVPLVTTGIETRTLAAPTFVGQQIVLYMKTDGGNCTVTCSTTINETGNNTITFANTGEAVLLTAVEEGSNLRWRAAQADGAVLSTV